MRPRMRLPTSPAELDRQNGVVTDAPDETAQQAADERERAIREEDESFGERARQDQGSGVFRSCPVLCGM